jgi:hypothetical protein
MAIMNFERSGDMRAVSPVKSVASIVAIIAALVSFYFSSQGREGLALMSALVAIVGGMVGAARALSPRVSGGLLSLAAIALGAIAVLVALIAFIV